MTEKVLDEALLSTLKETLLRKRGEKGAAAGLEAPCFNAFNAALKGPLFHG